MHQHLHALFLTEIFLLQYLIAQKHKYIKLLVSPGVTSAAFKEMVMRHVVSAESSLRPTLPPSTMNKVNQGKNSHLFFIDDLNMAGAGQVPGNDIT